MSEKATLFMPTFNRRELALLAIENLFENTEPRDVRELLIVDCSSEDGLEEDLRRLAKAPTPWPVRVVTIPDRHVVAAMQKARTMAKGELIAKVDSDTMVPPRWLEKLLSVMHRNPPLWALGMEARDEIEDLPADKYGFNHARFVGGIGLFQKGAWKGMVQTNATWFGWNEHQASRSWWKGWLKPSIRTFLLDYLPFEPFLSLQEHYFQKGWHRSRGTYYESQETLWNWKYPQWRTSRCCDVLVTHGGATLLSFDTRAAGEVYELETLDGARKPFPKGDVREIFRAVPGPADRLPDPEGWRAQGYLAYGVHRRRDALSGAWTFEGDAIVGAAPDFRLPVGADHGRLLLPGPVPEEYDLEAVVTRGEGTEDIGFGLVGGGRQVVFSFDAWGSWSGLFDVGRRAPNETYLGVQAPLFTSGPRRIQFRVRRSSLTVMVDGKLFWEWDADWKAVSVSPYHAVKTPGTLFLTTYKSTYWIEDLKLTAAKTED